MTKPFGEAIQQAQCSLEKTIAEYEVVRSAYAAGDIEEAYQRAFRYAAASEQQALQARDLPAYTGNPNAGRVMQEQIRTLVPIEIHEPPDKDWIAFTIPALLPKKEKGSALFIRLSLLAALADHYKDKPPHRIDNCTIVVKHLYDETRPEREYRDHDNIELNAAIDAIALFALVDDSPLRCRHYYCSAPAKGNSTEIHLMPNDVFMCWLVAENLFATDRFSG